MFKKKIKKEVKKVPTQKEIVGEAVTFKGEPQFVITKKVYTDEQLANMDLADLAKELNKPFVPGATTLEDLLK